MYCGEHTLYRTVPKLDKKVENKGKHSSTPPPNLKYDYLYTGFQETADNFCKEVLYRISRIFDKRFREQH
jgi:hypothetical protein